MSGKVTTHTTRTGRLKKVRRNKNGTFAPNPDRQARRNGSSGSKRANQKKGANHGSSPIAPKRSSSLGSPRTSPGKKKPPSTRLSQQRRNKNGTFAKKKVEKTFENTRKRKRNPTKTNNNDSSKKKRYDNMDEVTGVEALLNLSECCSQASSSSKLPPSSPVTKTDSPKSCVRAVATKSNCTRVCPLTSRSKKEVDTSDLVLPKNIWKRCSLHVATAYYIFFDQRAKQIAEYEKSPGTAKKPILSLDPTFGANTLRKQTPYAPGVNQNAGKVCPSTAYNGITSFPQVPPKMYPVPLPYFKQSQPLFPTSPGLSPQISQLPPQLQQQLLKSFQLMTAPLPNKQQTLPNSPVPLLSFDSQQPQWLRALQTGAMGKAPQPSPVQNGSTNPANKGPSQPTQSTTQSYQNMIPQLYWKNMQAPPLSFMGTGVPSPVVPGSQVPSQVPTQVPNQVPSSRASQAPAGSSITWKNDSYGPRGTSSTHKIQPKPTSTAMSDQSKQKATPRHILPRGAPVQPSAYPFYPSQRYPYTTPQGSPGASHSMAPSPTSVPKITSSQYDTTSQSSVKAMQGRLKDNRIPGTSTVKLSSRQKKRRVSSTKEKYSKKSKERTVGGSPYTPTQSQVASVPRSQGGIPPHYGLPPNYSSPHSSFPSSVISSSSDKRDDGPSATTVIIEDNSPTRGMGHRGKSPGGNITSTRQPRASESPVHRRPSYQEHGMQAHGRRYVDLCEQPDKQYHYGNMHPSDVPPVHSAPSFPPPPPLGSKPPVMLPPLHSSSQPYPYPFSGDGTRKPFSLLPLPIPKMN